MRARELFQILAGVPYDAHVKLNVMSPIHLLEDTDVQYHRVEVGSITFEETTNTVIINEEDQ